MFPPLHTIPAETMLLGAVRQLLANPLFVLCSLSISAFSALVAALDVALKQ